MQIAGMMVLALPIAFPLQLGIAEMLGRGLRVRYNHKPDATIDTPVRRYRKGSRVVRIGGQTLLPATFH